MKIVTLTLNPSLDRTMYFDSPFHAGSLNRASSTVVSLGGKGVNVSRVCKIIGRDTLAVTFIGGKNGDVFTSMLAEAGIPCTPVKSAAETRMNIKLIDSDDRCTEANEAGGPITPAELESITEAILNSCEAGDVVCMSGSIPRGIEKSVYASLTSKLKEKGARVILDCDGEALALGIEAKPDMIKPNLTELSELVGEGLSSVEDALEAASSLYERTGVAVLCTLSELGALYAGGEGVYTVTSPEVVLRGFVGAGDTFLTAFLCKYDESGEICEAMKLASSAAAAKVELVGTELPTRDGMEKFVSAVTCCKVR